MNADVTICIPTYRSREFIDRTLACARGQTHGAVRIVVSVDLCDDGTEEICHRHAREDARIEVRVQRERRGWSRNANAALDGVGTEFFFLYFHDDIIAPTYVDALRRALLARGDAASAHCDLVEFGLQDEVKPAHAYEGSTLVRLVDFMMTRRGATLRSLVRQQALPRPLRFPAIAGDNHWTAFVFHLELLAAGPAVAVHEPLYRRGQRHGSLTRSEGWAPRTVDTLLKGREQSHVLLTRLIDDAIADAAERRVAHQCLALFQRLFVREQEAALGSPPADLGPLDSPVAGVLPADAEAWVRAAESRLSQYER